MQALPPARQRPSSHGSVVLTLGAKVMIAACKTTQTGGQGPLGAHSPAVVLVVLGRSGLVLAMLVVGVQASVPVSVLCTMMLGWLQVRL
jgi:hypothetical protein